MEEQTSEQTEPQTEAPSRPEWLPEKFESAEHLAKSYSELETKIGQKEEDIRTKVKEEINAEFVNNRPASIGDYKLPEGLDETLTSDNPLLKWWSDHAFEKGLSQEQFQTGIQQYVDGITATYPDMDAERQKLGDNADSRIEAVTLWSQKFFDESMMPAIENLGQSAEGIMVLEKVIDALKGSSITPSGVSPSAISQEDLDNMMKDPRYWKPGDRDQAFVDKVTGGFNKLYGS